jgi:hypothetical protein
MGTPGQYTGMAGSLFHHQEIYADVCIQD